MDKQSQPRTLGAFAPVHHVVISFPTAQDMNGAANAMAALGYTGDALVRYTPQQMRAQVDENLAHASPIAALGQELNLVRAHGELADQGYSFLVVHAPQQPQAQEIAEVARRHHAERAQRYGHLVIEELIEPGREQTQVFESPARGLDAQNLSGQEKDRSTRR